MKRLALLTLAVLLQTGCLDNLLADCSVGGTGELSVLDAVSVDAIDFSNDGVTVELAGFANETDLRHVVFFLPAGMYVGRRGVSSFAVTDSPVGASVTFTTGVVDWEVVGQEIDDRAGEHHQPRFKVKLTGFGADDNRTHFAGTCPVEVL